MPVLSAYTRNLVTSFERLSSDTIMLCFFFPFHGQTETGCPGVSVAVSKDGRMVMCEGKYGCINVFRIRDGSTIGIQLLLTRRVSYC